MYSLRGSVNTSGRPAQRKLAPPKSVTPKLLHSYMRATSRKPTPTGVFQSPPPLKCKSTPADVQSQLDSFVPVGLKPMRSCYSPMCTYPPRPATLSARRSLSSLPTRCSRLCSTHSLIPSSFHLLSRETGMLRRAPNLVATGPPMKPTTTPFWSGGSMALTETLFAPIFPGVSRVETIRSGPRSRPFRTATSTLCLWTPKTSRDGARLNMEASSWENGGVIRMPLTTVWDSSFGTRVPLRASERAVRSHFGSANLQSAGHSTRATLLNLLPL